jgi:hypothetical protein
MYNSVQSYCAKVVQHVVMFDLELGKLKANIYLLIRGGAVRHCMHRCLPSPLATATE